MVPRKNIPSPPKHIHLRLQTLPQPQIIHLNLEPTLRLLVKVQSVPDLDHPVVVQANFPVVQVRVEGRFKYDVHFQQALFEFAEELFQFDEVDAAVETGRELDLAHRRHLDKSLAETDEILLLMWKAKIRFINDNFLRAFWKAGLVGSKKALS